MPRPAQISRTPRACVVAGAGGAEVGAARARCASSARLRACGHAYTGPFLVPAVAWQLHVHTNEVDLVPERPAVVFRVHTNHGGRAAPRSAGPTGGR